MEQEITRLEKKIIYLLENYKMLKSQVENLRKKNQSLKNTIEKQNQRLNDFQYQIKFSKIADRLVMNGESIILNKEKIDECIKEVEECIFSVDKKV